MTEERRRDWCEAFKDAAGQDTVDSVVRSRIPSAFEAKAENHLPNLFADYGKSAESNFRVYAICQEDPNTVQTRNTLQIRTRTHAQ